MWLIYIETVKLLDKNHLLSQIMEFLSTSKPINLAFDLAHRLRNKGGTEERDNSALHNCPLSQISTLKLRQELRTAIHY